MALWTGAHRIILLSGRHGELMASGHITGNLVVQGPSPYADVKAYGAVGDGVADDTAAIQAAIDSSTAGGPVVLPAGVYRITDTLHLRVATKLLGVGRGIYAQDYDTVIVAEVGAGVPAIHTPSSSKNLLLKDFQLRGPVVAGVSGKGIWTEGAANLVIENVMVFGFDYGVQLDYCSSVSIRDCHFTASNARCLYVVQVQGMHVWNTICANGIGGNAQFLLSSRDIIVDTPLQDETTGTGWDFESAYNVIFRCPCWFISEGGTTLHIGATSHHITIYDTRIEPFSIDRVAGTVIQIDSGAHDIRLINLSTDPNGGTDIVDNGTSTLWVNVNGRTKHPVVATASLPAAAAAENGRILIEDGGAGNQNLVVYSGNARYRIDGGTAF